MVTAIVPVGPALANKPRLDDLIGLLFKTATRSLARAWSRGRRLCPIRSAQDLPIGWTDRQAPGSYRLEKRRRGLFGYAVGPHSWKRTFFSTLLRLWQGQRTATGFTIQDEQHDPPPAGLPGHTRCKCTRLAVQPRLYRPRRTIHRSALCQSARTTFLIAVECEHPGGTCFCVSMGTGPEVRPERVPLLASKHETERSKPKPRARPGSRCPWRPRQGLQKRRTAVCDLVLTELDDAFVLRAVSPAGRGGGSAQPFGRLR